MAQIILHIGLRKTGTTSIQKFLHTNHETLLQHNILYPESGLPIKGSIYAHHDLATAITGVRPSSNLFCWETLKEEISLNEDKIVFISSEIFSVANPYQIEQLRRNLAGHKVKVLIYLRDPFNFMISLYKEQIRAHNEYRNFKKFSQLNLHLIDYDSLIKHWKLIFGDSNIILKNYDELAQDDLLIKNLLESLDLGNCYSEFTFNDKANVSPKDEVVIMIRHLNLMKKKIPLPLSTLRKIQANKNKLKYNNDYDGFFLKFYNKLMVKKIYNSNEMRGLGKKIQAYSCDYKNKFQNEINLTNLIEE
jgi:hypothetical protein